MVLSLLSFKVLAALLIFLTSLVAVIYPVKMRAHPTHHPILERADAFASGIFLGTALFHMLPDAITSFRSFFPNIHYPIAESLCAFGFLALLLLERISEYASFAKRSANHIAYMMTLILVIHALIEGSALGVNTTFATVSVIFLAIIAHKSSESFALAVILNKGTLKLKVLITIISVFALMTPLGIFLGASLTQYLQLKEAIFITATFNALAAGTFLYMSTLHHINHHHHKEDGESLIEYVYLVMGLFVMAVVAYWA
jgi:zinc transporter 1/2/3